MKLAAIALICVASLPVAPLFAADEKIDPKTYICAELVASSIDGVPPIYEALQLDGFAAGKKGEPAADPEMLQPLLLAVSDSCAAEPTDQALAHWEKARSAYPPPQSAWRADKTTCADYAANPDDGSGFVIWLDAYNRAGKNTDKSVLVDQAALDSFLDACGKNPGKLMLDVLADSAK